MPLLKPESLPIPSEEVTELRARLLTPLSHDVIARDDQRYLFVRAQGDVPHPVHDLEAAFEALPAWKTQGLTEVFLLGARSDLHVPGHIARPVLEGRLRLDAAIADEARATLDVHYGVTVHRTPADAANRRRLLARIPRDRCSSLAEQDLSELAARVGPLHDAGQLGDVLTCYLVAGHDHMRFLARDFLGDLVERWNVLRDERQQSVVKAVPIEPRDPRRVEDVTPAFELEQEIAAIPDDPSSVPGLEGATATLARTLSDAGYTVTLAPFLGDAPFAALADRTLLYPHRVAIAVRSRFDREDAVEALALVRQHELDLLLVAAPDPLPEALRRLSASKVKVITPAQVADYRP